MNSLQPVFANSHVPNFLSKVENKKIGHRITQTITDEWIDMGQVIADFDRNGWPDQIAIFADIIAFPIGFKAHVPKCRMILFARRFECEGEAVFNLHSEQTGARIPLVILTDPEQISEKGKIIITASPGETSANKTVDLKDALSTVGSVGAAFEVLKGSELLIKPRGTAAYSGNRNLASVLTSQFQRAATIFDSHPADAELLLKWIEQVGNNWPSEQDADDFDPVPDLHAQVMSLRMLLTATSGKSRFVPKLSDSIYRKLAKNYFEAAQKLEAVYLEFDLAEREVKRERAKELVQLAKAQDDTSLAQKILDQTQGNLDNARSAVDLAQHRFSTQQFTLEIAQIKLNGGIAEWKIDKTVEIVKDSLFAIVEFGAGIASLSSGNPEGGKAAGDGVKKTVKAGEEAAKAADKASKTSSKLKDLMKKILTMMKATKAIVEKSSKLAKFAVKNVNKPGAKALLPGTIPDESIWDEFLLAANGALQPAVDAKIGGASSYLTALKIYCYRARALQNSRVNLIKIEQEFVRQSLELKLKKRQTERLKALLDDFLTDVNAFKELEQICYDIYANQKRMIFVTLEYYRWAYYYHALKETPIKASMTSSIHEMTTQSNQISKDEIDGLFGAPPSGTKGIEIDIANIKFEAVKDNDLDKIRARFSIALDEVEFDHYDRVRLNSIWVYIKDAKSRRKDSEVHIWISNCGDFQDRLGSEQYDFTGEPYHQQFVYYDVDQAKDRDDQEDFKHYKNVRGGQAEDRVALAYMRPTPFTHWTIELLASEAEIPTESDVSIVLNASTLSREI